MLSTVTYLGHSRCRSPTVIVDATHHNQSEPTAAWVVYPRAGKHVAFDGALLHGVPVHWDDPEYAGGDPGRKNLWYLSL